MTFKKSNVKKAVITVVTALFLGVLFTNMYAAIPPDTGIISPQWSSIANVSSYISYSGKTVYPEVIIETTNTTTKIAGTIYLEKYSSGKWVPVSQWNISGTGSLSDCKSYTGTSGTHYRTKLIVDIGSEHAEAVSNSCYVK